MNEDYVKVPGGACPYAPELLGAPSTTSYCNLLFAP